MGNCYSCVNSEPKPATTEKRDQLISVRVDHESTYVYSRKSTKIIPETTRYQNPLQQRTVDCGSAVQLQEKETTQTVHSNLSKPESVVVQEVSIVSDNFNSNPETAKVQLIKEEEQVQQANSIAAEPNIKQQSSQSDTQEVSIVSDHPDAAPSLSAVSEVRNVSHHLDAAPDSALLQVTEEEQYFQQDNTVGTESIVDLQPLQAATGEVSVISNQSDAAVETVSLQLIEADKYMKEGSTLAAESNFARKPSQSEYFVEEVKLLPSRLVDITHYGFDSKNKSAAVTIAPDRLTIDLDERNNFSNKGTAYPIVNSVFVDSAFRDTSTAEVTTITNSAPPLYYVEFTFTQLPTTSRAAVALANPLQFKIPNPVNFRVLNKDGKSLPGSAFPGTFAYASTGTFSAGGMQGFGWPLFKEGDTVGMGLGRCGSSKLAIFFTLNGACLGVATDEVYEPILFPLLSLEGQAKFKVTVNSGRRPFLYDPIVGDSIGHPACGVGGSPSTYHLLHISRHGADTLTHFHVDPLPVTVTGGGNEGENRLKVVLPGPALFIYLARRLKSSKQTLQRIWDKTTTTDDGALKLCRIASFDEALLSSGTYNGEMRQMNTGDWNAGDKEAGAGSVYAHNATYIGYSANAVDTSFRLILDAAIRSAGLPDHSLLHAPNKSDHRVDNKANERYSRRLPGKPVAWVYDAVRSSITCDTPAQIEAMLISLNQVCNSVGGDAEQCPPVAISSRHPHTLTFCPTIYQGSYGCDICGAGGKGAAYHCEKCGWDAHPSCVHPHCFSARVVRVKNRFAQPSLTGYRDILVNIRVTVGHTQFRQMKTQELIRKKTKQLFSHTCELQIHFRPLETSAHSLQTHRLYEFFRSYLGGSGGDKKTTQLLKTITLLDNCPELLFVSDSAAAGGLLDTLVAAAVKPDALNVDELHYCTSLLQHLGSQRHALLVAEAALARVTDTGDPEKSAREVLRLAAVLRTCGHTERAVQLETQIQGSKDRSAEFLQMARRFLKCRVSLTDYWKSISSGVIEARSGIDEVTISSGPGPEVFNAAMRQHKDLSNSIFSLKDLYEVAADASSPYQQALINALRMANLPLSLLSFAPLKGQDRAIEKARDDYSVRDPGPAISWLFDIVRASVTCDNEEQVDALLTALTKLQTDSGDKVRLVRFKNRFARPTPGGFRDLNLSIRVKVRENTHHVCELQVHHSGMEETGHHLNSHTMYEFFRSYFKGNTSAVDRRLLELQKVIGYVQSDDDTLDTLTQAVESAGVSQDMRDCIELLRFMGENERALSVAKSLVSQAEIRHNAAITAGADSTDVSSTHLEVLAALSLAGTLAQIADEKGTAKSCFERALAGREAMLGPDHLETLSSLHLLGALQLSCGDFSGAKVLLTKAEEARRRLLGAEAADTLASAAALGQCLFEGSAPGDEGSTDRERAVLLQKEALAGRESALGALHADTLTSCHTLGAALLHLNDVKSAKPLLEKAASGRERLLGPDSNDTRASQQLLGSLMDNPSHLALLREAVKKYDRKYFVPLLMSPGLWFCSDAGLVALMQAITDMDGRVNDEIGGTEGAIEVLVSLLGSTAVANSVEVALAVCRVAAECMGGSDPRRRRFGDAGACEMFVGLLQSSRCLESAALAEWVLLGLSEMTLSDEYRNSKMKIVAAGAPEVVIVVMRTHYKERPIVARNGARLVSDLINGFPEHMVRLCAAGGEALMVEIMDAFDDSSVKEERWARDAAIDAVTKLRYG